ncbi:MAG: hypothetical protein OHK0018_01520 [Erythrobacter tepidarius]
MGHIEIATNVAWTNFHKNRKLTVARQATYRRGGQTAASGAEAFARSAPVMQAHIATALAHQARAGVLGAAWSWSALIGNADLQLATDELDALHAVQAGDLHRASRLDASHLAYVGGGCRLARLVGWAEARDRSIAICGSYLGQSVAGAMATGVNGSTLGQGGFQNQIRGIHLVTGPARSVWIEDPSCPALSDAAALRFADEVIRDSTAFAAALVHLGALGIVNGVLFELVDKHLFYPVRCKRIVDPAWLAEVERGDYDAIARGLGLPGNPIYYEVQIDPYDPWGTPALHSFIFRHEAATAPRRAITDCAHLRQVDDLIEPSSGKSLAPPIPPDLYAAYAASFHEIAADPPQLQSWGALHSGGPHPRTHTIIYDAALAIDQNRIKDAITAMSSHLQQQLQQLPAEHRLRHMVYTLRFVEGSAGLMGYTRYRRSVAIDLHGLIPSPLTHKAAADSCAALDAAGIGYCQHWGKFTPGNPGWVAREFGGGQPDSPLAEWRKMRRRLLDPLVEPLFRNDALVDWGVL